ncbi:hypothetical protein JTE90_023342 [Oedothorax gibbosus]|uniref:Ig-like domain-containing protein n=1 Tax=Oedothorax gibbosus TaxID=931172 RepID=A0AAV6VGT2_9ARAC|nr:hypothetical protein JTE90_023342 [Oedothorax gibbosus]
MAGPPRFLRALPIETDATDGDIVTFQVKVSSCSDDPTTVSWWRCGEPLRAVPGHREIIEHEDGWYELVLSNITQEDEGEYECRAENDIGHNSSFGSLYYYREGGGTASDMTMEGIIAEGDGRQSGLLILIDDGSNTEESLSGHSDRKSMTVSEQMQGIIEDLTQSSQEQTGSMTFEKEDEMQFCSDIEDLCDDDLEANAIQDILGLTSRPPRGSQDTLVPEMASPDTQTDVAISEGASDPYAPTIPLEPQKWKSNPNISKKVKDDKKENEGDVIWPPEASMVTFDLPDDTATTSVELPFARGSTTEDDPQRSSWRCADTPFDVADIVEEAVDVGTRCRDADSLRQSPLDDSTSAAVEADSAVNLVAYEEVLTTPTQIVDSRVASRIEQDTSLTSVTEFSGEAIPPEGHQRSKMSFTRSSFKAASYQYSGDGVMDTSTSIRTSSGTSRISSDLAYEEESLTVSKSSRMTRRAGELEESVSVSSKKTKYSSADESSYSVMGTATRSLGDTFMAEGLSDSRVSEKN